MCCLYCICIDILCLYNVCNAYVNVKSVCVYSSYSLQNGTHKNIVFYSYTYIIVHQ